MKRKIFIGMFVLCLVFGTLFAVSACGEEDENGGGGNPADTGTQNPPEVEKDPTEGLEYTLSEDGTYYIVSGIGAATDADIIIPSVHQNLPVAEIGQKAFRNCMGINSVTIPESVRSIGISAFEQCYALTSVVIPVGVKQIEGAAFCDCTALTSINIPNSVTSIREDTFANCPSLVSITVGSENTTYLSENNCLIERSTKTLVAGCRNSIIPNDESVTKIGRYAFWSCTELEILEIPNNITSIDTEAFVGCTSLKSITVGSENSVYYSSENCIIEKLTGTLILGCKSSIIPKDGSVRAIGDNAFRNCTGLTSIEIPGSISSIGDYSFEGCIRLKEIYNQSSLPILKGSTSYGFIAYYAINVYNTVSGESKLDYCDDGYIFYEDGETVYLLGYTGIDTELVLPDNYKNKSYGIYQYAFYECANLTSVTIGAGAVSIDSTAFNYCSGLTSIAVDSENEVYYSLNNCIIEKLTKTLIAGCKNSIIPSDGSVTSIGEYAFCGCSALESIEIGNIMVSSNAFADCYFLKKVIINDFLVLSEYAFVGCKNLMRIDYNGTIEDWDAKVFKDLLWDHNTGNYAVYCSNGTISKENA